jgi:hypothetical protein
VASRTLLALVLVIGAFGAQAFAPAIVHAEPGGGLLDGLGDAVNEMTSGATGAAGSVVEDVSTSTQTDAASEEGQPEPVVPALSGTVEQATSPLAGSLEPVSDSVTDALVPVTSAAGEAVTPLAEAVSEAMTPVTEAAGETLETAATQAGELVETLDPLVEPVAGAAAPVAEATQPVTGPVVATTASVTTPIAEALQPVTAALDPAIEPLTSALEPVAESLQPLATALQPAVEPVREVLQPVVDPLTEPLAPVTGPVEEVLEPVLDPIAETLDPAMSPVEEPVSPPGPIFVPEVPSPGGELPGALPPVAEAPAGNSTAPGLPVPSQSSPLIAAGPDVPGVTNASAATASYASREESRFDSDIPSGVSAGPVAAISRPHRGSPAGGPTAGTSFDPPAGRVDYPLLAPPATARAPAAGSSDATSLVQSSTPATGGPNTSPRFDWPSASLAFTVLGLLVAGVLLVRAAGEASPRSWQSRPYTPPA